MAYIINGVTLTRGVAYTRKKLGITYPESLHTGTYVGGNRLSFFTMNNAQGYKNEDQEDGFVYELGSGQPVPKGIQSKAVGHIFVRENDVGAFTYRGKSCYEMYYSDRQNKVYYEECVPPQTRLYR
jgi:hypothetical protein